ncbi:MAG: ABC transporter substrate-binding protein [Solirubrobacterales bacterium]|nr:ABC transporter substrate-binding protein [Solirubrobacterales bacterium]
MRKPIVLTLAVVAAIAVGACGSKSEDVTPQTEPLSLSLDWYPNPDHVGIYTAKEAGFFDDAGLDVNIDTPTDPALPIKLVAAGKADLAVSYEPEVLLAREQGLDVVAVGSIVNQPLTSMMWLKKSKIKRVANLKGKTVSTAGIPYQDAYLKTILARAGLNEGQVTKVGVGQGLMPSIVSGKAAATLGPYWNIEGVDLKLSGKKPVINPVDKLGVPTYDELVVVAQGQRIKEDPDAIRLFMSALARGTGQAVAAPNAATDTMLAANPSLDPKVTAAQVKVTLPLLDSKTEDEPFGYMNPADWQDFINWMVESGVLSGSQRAVDALDNEMLPGGPVDPN